jgi:hypothetical protein
MLALATGEPMRTAVALSLCLLFAGPAKARNVEPGKLVVTGAVGPSFRMGSRLGGSRGNLTLDAGGEYTFSKKLSAVGDLALGLAGTIPLKLRAGARYRITDLNLPVSPYGQAQLSFGRLYDVIGANMNFFGVRLAGGADYFLTAKLGFGALLGMELTSTLAETKAFYGSFDVLAYASYTF